MLASPTVTSRTDFGSTSHGPSAVFACSHSVRTRPGPVATAARPSFPSPLRTRIGALTVTSRGVGFSSTSAASEDVRAPVELTATIRA